MCTAICRQDISRPTWVRCGGRQMNMPQKRLWTKLWTLRAHVLAAPWVMMRFGVPSGAANDLGTVNKLLVRPMSDMSVLYPGCTQDHPVLLYPNVYAPPAGLEPATCRVTMTGALYGTATLEPPGITGTSGTVRALDSTIRHANICT